MKLSELIYFYEGDYISHTWYLYRGIGSSNFMVIKGDSQVMIDSGITSGPHSRRIKAQLKQDGIKPGNTSTILLSHTHPDHVMHAKNMSRKNPLSFITHIDGEQMSHRSSFQFEAHYNYPEFVLREIFNTPVWMARLIVRTFFDFDYIRPDRKVKDFELLNLGTDARIIPLPSHFPGHIGVYFPAEKILYSADLFDFRVAEGGIINNAQSSYSSAFSDIKRLSGLDVEVMVPGHGRIIRGRSMVRVTLDRIMQGTHDYQVLIKRAVSGPAAGRTLSEITSSIFHDSNAYNLTARKIIIYNTLTHMKSEDRADYTLKNGRAFWRA
ncbi:MAG: MBL fold metallo-hydrolase [Spirochaetes bacterium]|nr:MBL fold metallo-hydrolase [Spirochaetota bacterium]